MERDLLEDIGIDESFVLKWMLKQYNGRVWTGLIWQAVVSMTVNMWVSEMWGFFD